jgi:hypothetical protein
MAIDGKQLLNKNIKTVREMLVGAPGSRVTLLLQRREPAQAEVEGGVRLANPLESVELMRSAL